MLLFLTYVCSWPRFIPLFVINNSLAMLMLLLPHVFSKTWSKIHYNRLHLYVVGCSFVLRKSEKVIWNRRTNGFYTYVQTNTKITSLAPICCYFRNVLWSTISYQYVSNSTRIVYGIPVNIRQKFYLQNFN